MTKPKPLPPMPSEWDLMERAGIVAPIRAYGVRAEIVKPKNDTDDARVNYSARPATHEPPYGNAAAMERIALLERDLLIAKSSGVSYRDAAIQQRKESRRLNAENARLKAALQEIASQTIQYPYEESRAEDAARSMQDIARDALRTQEGT